MTREPIVEGQFYEFDSDRLNKQIESCFKSPFGPKDLPSKDRKKRILGIISPHAGYPASGPCQAFSYKELGESEIPDIYIIFGISHSGFDSCISTEQWKTPFGIVETDKEFGETLSAISNIPIDEVAHQNEHSIEVQIPFLQFINKNNDFKIVPILISPDIDVKSFAKSIKKTIGKTKRTYTFIASSDFTHYGSYYGFTPFSDNQNTPGDIKEKIYNLDKGAIDFIKKLDTDSFLEYIEKTRATICGQYAIAALLETTKLLGAKKAELLKYYTSGDLTENYTNSVGYASIIIE